MESAQPERHRAAHSLQAVQEKHGDTWVGKVREELASDSMTGQAGHRSACLEYQAAAYTQPMEAARLIETWKGGSGAVR